MTRSSDDPIPLRLGTRGSLLARTQSQWVADELMRIDCKLRVELRIFKTSGDQVTDGPLHEVGGKGLFTKELEQALLAGEIDFAVHSYKDVPVTMPLVDQSDLIVAATPKREDPRDVLATRSAPSKLADLPRGARVGTGSLRRRCQLLATRPDFIIEPVRGNIDTRLRKLRDGQYDALVLALAGLRRTGLFDPSTMTVVDTDELLPAPGQGALALQCRRRGQRTREILGSLNDPDTAASVAAERALVSLLEGDCRSPIAALATVEADTLVLRAAVGARGGDPPVVRASVRTSKASLDEAAKAVFKDLDARCVRSMLGTGASRR